MYKRLCVLSVCLLLNISVTAQFSQAARDSIAKLTRLDFEHMKASMGIEIPNRPGPSGNPNDANAANTSEAGVKSYILPDLMVLKNGDEVTTEEDWSERRRELFEEFDKEVYGHVPVNLPGINWVLQYEKDTVTGNYQVRERLLYGIVDNSEFPETEVVIELLLVTPSAVNQSVPVVLEFGFIRNPFGRQPEETNPLFSPGEPDWKEQVISRNYGYAIINPYSIQADNGAGLRQGIIGLANKGDFRKPSDWGALRAWAWGASRALDYMEDDPYVDGSKVAIAGLSRFGKAALVTMAYDNRFSLGFIGSSGAGGAKLLRRNFGEQVENLASSGEYHWFCGNFIKYASTLTVDDLPVDAHELIALCAPRPVFVSAGSPHIEGGWVDARGMFEAAVAAAPAYLLLGRNGLGTSEFPPLGTPLVHGEIAFRQHAGGHSMGPNWSTWLAWACKYWGECAF